MPHPMGPALSSLTSVILPSALITESRVLRGRFDRYVKIVCITLPLWLYVLVAVVVVYWMLYHLYPPS